MGAPCATGIELAWAPEAGTFRAWYRERLPNVGFLQGPFPMAPGEHFSVAVCSTGTFGKIGLGVAPWHGQQQPGVGAILDVHTAGGGAGGTSPARVQGILPAPSAGAAPVSGTPTMVGWTTSEVGFHGDHGRCYYMGSGTGRQVSAPWEDGDVIVCGITPKGGIYFSRNGTPVAESPAGWPVWNAYPTITCHSGGLELTVSFGQISEKLLAEVLPGVGVVARSPAELLAAFRRADTVQPSPNGLLGRWLGVCCGSSGITKASNSDAIVAQN